MGDISGYELCRQREACREEKIAEIGWSVQGKILLCALGKNERLLQPLERGDMKKIIAIVLGVSFISFCIKQIPSDIITELFEEATANVLEWLAILKHRLSSKSAK
ncbi:hypothetical protein [Gluconobacter oxydans]|uniref:hypothetical protein n=2 Tax=Gluconobacter TaxID=441 RepID=UPI00062C79AD|nr:hypothetical protein [Gluconobacter oxydans]